MRCDNFLLSAARRSRGSRVSTFPKEQTRENRGNVGTMRNIYVCYFRYVRSWNESKSIFEGGKKILEKLSIVLISGKIGN